MPFPHHDRYWMETLHWLQPRCREPDTLLAPDEFAEHFAVVYRYEATCNPARRVDDWLVLHKGQLGRIHSDLLKKARFSHRAVFANEVFVVLTNQGADPAVPKGNDHVRAFDQLVAEREKLPPPAVRNPDVIARPPIWRLTTEQIRDEMNKRFLLYHDEFGGYEHEHLWDRVRYHEIDETFRQLLGSVEGKSILEMACGLGRNVSMVESCTRYLGLDLSDVAIEKASRKFADRPHLSFLRTDACQSGLPDGEFDVVLAIEVIEHVHEPERLIAEAFRMLKPGGRFLINSANRDSLHLRMARKLGPPALKATLAHIREFGFSEMSELLQKAGFRIRETRGCFLLPYYGIPELDPHVRRLTDDDPETVETFRRLGQLAGAEFAYEFVIVAEKPACI